MVFNTKDYNNKWDGKNCDFGIYVWILKTQDSNGNIHTEKGTVTLLKQQ